MPKSINFAFSLNTIHKCVSLYYKYNAVTFESDLTILKQLKLLLRII